MGVIEINWIKTHQAKVMSSLCPVGFHVFHSLKRVSRNKTKQKCPIKPLFDKILTGFFFLSDLSVSIDKMILNILQELEKNSSSQRRWALLLSPSSAWSTFHRTERREPLWQLAFQFGDSHYHHEGLFFPSYDEIYIHTAEAPIWVRAVWAEPKMQGTDRF